MVLHNNYTSSRKVQPTVPTFHHGVKDLDNDDQSCAEDDQRHNQEDDSNLHVGELGVIEEEVASAVRFYQAALNTGFGSRSNRDRSCC